mgnify:CR=1 FL=1
MTIRRTLLKTFVGMVPLNLLGQNKSHALNINQSNLNPLKRDYYKELGIKPFINAAGAYSVFGGAKMREDTISAMRYAAENKVKIRELPSFKISLFNSKISEKINSSNTLDRSVNFKTA